MAVMSMLTASKQASQYPCIICRSDQSGGAQAASHCISRANDLPDVTDFRVLKAGIHIIMGPSAPRMMGTRGI